ncbi:MAG: MATE family efflux transporter, partial [Tannerella sp.]|nr:MATE family efflux transporter [Tannerella sp.]
ELAIANIVRSVYVVMFIPVNSLATATNTLVSNTMGATKILEVIPLIRKISKISFGVMVCFATVLCLFPHAILSIYTNDPSLLSASVPSLYVIAAVSLICSVAVIVFNGLSGTGNTRPAFILEAGILVVYVLYLYIVGIRMRQPVHICYIVELVYFIGLLACCILYFRFARWDKKKI